MKFLPKNLITTLIAAALLSACFDVQLNRASIKLVFSDGDAFDGNVVGDTVSLAGGLDLTTQALNSTGLSLNSVTPANPANAGLGINSVGGNTMGSNPRGDGSGRFDALSNPSELEFWSFSFNSDINFEGIDFALLGNSEAMTLGSAAWIGLTLVPATPAAVTFDSVSGVFTLGGSGVPGDDFTLNDLTGGDSLFVSAGESITIGAAADTSARLQSLTLTAVPEASSCLIWGLFSLIVVVRARKPADRDSSATF